MSSNLQSLGLVVVDERVANLAGRKGTADKAHDTRVGGELEVKRTQLRVLRQFVCVRFAVGQTDATGISVPGRSPVKSSQVSSSISHVLININAEAMAFPSGCDHALEMELLDSEQYEQSEQVKSNRVQPLFIVVRNSVLFCSVLATLHFIQQSCCVPYAIMLACSNPDRHYSYMTIGLMGAEHTSLEAIFTTM